MGKLKLWTPEEDNILVATSTLAVSKKWKKASDELRRRGYERSDIECRERYVNHLDPTVTKGTWSDAELQILYNKFSEYSNKWFLLQKHLPGRTQTKIKNYFYGNIRFLLKIIIKCILNTKAGFVNDIKTDILLDIYQGKNDFEGIHLIEKTIKRLNYRVDKKSCEKLIKEHKEVFQIFARDYLMDISQKNQNNVKQEDQNQEEQEEGQSNDEPNEPENGNITKIQLVTLVQGEIKIPENQLQYLDRMSKLHQFWHLHYQNAYQELLQKIDYKEEHLPAAPEEELKQESP